jgi:hypothetical protein
VDLERTNEMELACEEVVPNLGCDYVATGGSADEVHATMMGHGGENHSDLMDGKTPEEMQKAGQEMDAHIRGLLGSR